MRICMSMNSEKLYLDIIPSTFNNNFCTFLKLFSMNFLGSVVEGTEKAMAPHSSTLAWKMPWIEEPGRLQSMGSLRVGHD